MKNVRKPYCNDFLKKTTSRRILSAKDARASNLLCRGLNKVVRWAVIFDADPGLCLSHVRTLGPKRNLEHRSFFSLERYVSEFIQIISFFEINSFKRRCETVIGIVPWCCHQTCCLLRSLGEINSGIQMYQFTFEPYTSVFGWGCGLGFEQKFWRIDGFGGKKARIGGFAYPYSPPSMYEICPWTKLQLFQWACRVRFPNHKNTWHGLLQKELIY